MLKMLSLFWCLMTITLCFAQDCKLNKSLKVPTNRQVYMLGDFHLDAKQYIHAEDSTIKNTIAAEDALRNYLVDKCDVKHFFMESSVSFEYFFNKYFETGDTGWIFIFNQQKYEIAKLESLRSIYVKHPDISVNCIDVVQESYVPQMLMTLYALSFYEHFQEYYTPPLNNTPLFPPWNDINVGIRLLDSLPQCNDTITPFLGPIIQSLIAPDVNTNYNLYYLFRLTLQSAQAQEALQKFYGDDYSYVMRIIRGYVFGYGKSLDDILFKYRQQREDVIEETVKQLLVDNNSGAYLIQMGNAHLDADSTANMLRYRLMQNNITAPFCFYNVQSMAKDFFEKTFHTTPLDFSFSSSYCFHRGPGDNVYVLVK